MKLYLLLNYYLSILCDNMFNKTLRPNVLPVFK